MVDRLKINKIEYNKSSSHKLKLYFKNAELVFNRDTTTWDIDLRGVTDFEFEYQDKIHLTIYLENDQVYRGETYVNTTLSSENFNLQGISGSEPVNGIES